MKAAREYWDGHGVLVIDVGAVQRPLKDCE